MPVIAELVDGRVVALPKDCACQTHDGPHWLHMDRIDRDQNRGLLQAARRNGTLVVALLHEHAAAELRRLAEKDKHLRANRVARIIPHPSEADLARLDQCPGPRA